jgi:hypothetical protein
MVLALTSHDPLADPVSVKSWRDRTMQKLHSSQGGVSLCCISAAEGHPLGADWAKRPLRLMPPQPRQADHHHLEAAR